MLTLTKQWLARCSSPWTNGKCIQIDLWFSGDIPPLVIGDRVPLPAGFGLYLTQRRGIRSPTTSHDEVHAEASLETLETVAAWLTSPATRLPDNITSYEITARANWKQLSSRT